MNCRLCIEKMEEYLEGKMPPDTKTQVEAHLRECEQCNNLYMEFLSAEEVIREEKELLPDPFLTSRIMAEVESTIMKEPHRSLSPVRILKPLVITISAAAAIFAGIVLGYSLTHFNNGAEKAPSELALSNDAVIESVNFLANE